MKRLYILLLLLLAFAPLSAQRFQRRGWAFGVDRDTNKYIVASPFDNWYIHLQGGIQTFIGNELWASARHNKLNYTARAEVGKWIIPDVSIGLRFSYFDVDGQSLYSLQPFINYAEDTPNSNGYYPFHAHAIGIMGIVNFDWTNFFHGYEVGKNRKVHVFTPVGLGMTVLLGKHRNTNPRSLENHSVGELRHNYELAFTGGIGVEYIPNEHITFSLITDLSGSESTWDWSPYDNEHSIFDFMPSVRLGVRFNLLKSVVKRDPYTQTAKREKVNHEFLTFGTVNTVSNLNGRIDRLSGRIDSLLATNEADSAELANLMNEMNALQDRLDSSQAELDRRPPNMLADLIINNELLNLPATIVYYRLDKYDIDYNGHKRLINFAKDMKHLGDTLQFYIIGAADSATGTPRRNQWLSEHRCQAALDVLVNHCKISPSQFVSIPLGGISDYEPQENNRMALIILRTPETEAIVRRWLQSYGRPYPPEEK